MPVCGLSVLDLTAQTRSQILHNSAERKNLRSGDRAAPRNYGEIPFLIVDGWNAPEVVPPYEMLPFEELDHLVKSLQPDCMLMNIGLSEGLSGTDVVFYEETPPVRRSTIASTVNIAQQTDKTWFWRDEHQTAPVTSAEWALSK